MEQTADYAVTVQLAVGLAGEPLPTDPKELLRLLAENFVDLLQTILNGRDDEAAWDDVARNIVRVEPLEGDTLPQHVLPRTISFTMPHENASEEGHTEGRVEFGDLGIEVTINGHGMKCMEPGFGSIIYVNHFDGSPQVIIHGDINQEDPTHSIQLSSASEDHRGQTCAPMPRHRVERSNNNLDNRPTVIHYFNRPGPASIVDLDLYLKDHGHAAHRIISVLCPVEERSVGEQAHAAFEATRRAEDEYHQLGTCIATWMAGQGLNNDKREGE